MGKESEAYRLQMLRRLQQKNCDPPPAEVLEAQKVIAKYRQEQTQAGSAISRFSQPLPKPDLCPSCFGFHGVISPLAAIPHTDPANFDKMTCRICGYDEERTSRP